MRRHQVVVPDGQTLTAEELDILSAEGWDLVTVVPIVRPERMFMQYIFSQEVQ